MKGHAWRIVLADDNVEFLHFLVTRLQGIFGPQAQVLAAIDGQQAYSHLVEAPADLLLTDFNMPGMDGGQLVERLLAEGRLKGLPVVVITGGLDAHQDQRLRQAGVKRILEKPFSGARLHHAVLEALGPDLAALLPPAPR